MGHNSHMSTLGRQFDKQKRQRTMAYQYEDAGITFCPSCHKIALTDPSKFGIQGQEPTVKKNTDYETGDLETCSGGCGKTIFGRKGTYE
jgi:hypothetical protein